MIESRGDVVSALEQIRFACEELSEIEDPFLRNFAQRTLTEIRICESQAVFDPAREHEAD